MDTEQSSEAVSQPQENVAAQSQGIGAEQAPASAPLPATPSKGKDAAQEPKTLTLTEAEYQDRIRREAQSMKDREIHRTRMQWEREQEARQQQAELARQINELDDEDFGRISKEKLRAQQEQVRAQQQQQEALAATFNSMIESTATRLVPDAKARDEVLQRAYASEFKDWGEFEEACAESYANSKVAKERAKWEQEARAAAMKEVTAKHAEDAAPQLGAGLPTAPLNVKALSTDKKLALGYQQAVEAQRKKRGG